MISFIIYKRTTPKHSGSVHVHRRVRVVTGDRIVYTRDVLKEKMPKK